MASAYAKMMLYRLVVAALMAGIALPAMAARLDCGQMLASEMANQTGKPTVSEAQRQLGELGFDTGGVDGLLGPKTRSALMRFCSKAEFALSGDLWVVLRNHADIHRVYPDWQSMLASNAFLKWAKTQNDAAEIGRISQNGDATGVIAVLDRYQKRRMSGPRLGTGVSDLVSYMLTPDDFEQLRSRKTVSKLMAKLLNAGYADQDEFEAAAGAALKGVADASEYVQLAEKYAEQKTSYRISAKSLDELKVGNVPEFVLQAIQGMKDLDYPGDAIDEAVETELGKLIERTMAFNPRLLTLVEISPSGAGLSESRLAKFAEAQQNDLLAVAILERLRKLLGVIYKDDKALAWAMQMVLKDVTDQIDTSRTLILAHAEEMTVYAFDQKCAREIDRKINESVVPELYLEMMDGMQNLDYPDAELFWLAAKARVSMSGPNHALRKTIFGVIEQHAADKTGESLLEGLKAAKLPPAVLARLEALPGLKLGDADALKKQVDESFKQLGKEFKQYRLLVAAQARKTHPFDQTKIIQWSGESCNCVYSNLAGDVYGIYPYWMAGGKQVIDFSVQTRIGYYGLSFDDKGNIAHASRWSGLDSGFIREARTYGTRVDLVIYRNDWRGWDQIGSEEKTALFENLAENIAELIGTPLSDFFSELKPYISLGTAPVPVMGDGVTLYFSGYPQDMESISAFERFIVALRKKLDSHGREYAVNLMFSSLEMDNGIYANSTLVKLMDILSEDEDKSNSLFLVLLQEPTSESKRDVRAKIENGLHGKQRMRLRRNVAMVLSFDGKNIDQLTDDVIYAKDDFGGIGFWTQPVASGMATTDGALVRASDVLQKNFLYAENGETALKPAVCQFICPNRWAFRIAWDIFILILLVSIPLYLMACDWRNFFDRNFIRFIAAVIVPALLLTFALLFCDPAWEAVSRGNGILIFVIAGILAYSIWNYHDRKRKADLP